MKGWLRWRKKFQVPFGVLIEGTQRKFDEGRLIEVSKFYFKSHLWCWLWWQIISMKSWLRWRKPISGFILRYWLRWHIIFNEGLIEMIKNISSPFVVLIQVTKIIATRGVSHCGLAISIKKYLNAKEELWKFKYFTMQKYNLQKHPLKETQIPQDMRCLWTWTIENPKFQKKYWYIGWHVKSWKPSKSQLSHSAMWI